MPPLGSDSVTLLVGPASSGKTAAALGAYGAALAEASFSALRRTLWVAPTRTAARDVREALVDPARAVLDPGVMTFGDLAAQTVRDAGRRLRLISRLQRRRLLGRLIDQSAAAGRLAYFAPVAESPGLVGLFDETIAHLQRRGLSPQAFREAAPPHDAPRAHDVADLYARYLKILEAAELADDAGLVRHAESVLAAALPTAAAFDLVIIDGFTDFNAGELGLIKQLAARARRMIVTLPGEAGRQVLGDPPTWTWTSASIAGRHAHADEGMPRRLRSELLARPVAAIEALLQIPGATIESIESFEPTDDPWPALAHLQRNLFRNYRELEPPPPAVVQSLARIQIVAASGVQAEIDEIARRVKRLLVDGTAPQDVVVAFRSTRDVADRVRQTFDDFGIPTALDAARRLAATPLVRSLTNVLRLAAEDWPYRRVLQAAGDRSLRVFDALEDGGKDARRAIETCARHAQLPHGRGALLAQLDRWAKEGDAAAEPTADAAALAATALRQWAAMLDMLPRAAPSDGWIGALGPLAERLGLIRPAAGDTAGNWAILVDSLRATARIDAWTGWGADEVSLAEFVELLATVAAQTPATERRDATGRVRVLSADAARFTRPRHLLIGNLSEQAFPAARRAASNVDGDGDARSDEMLLFYQLATRPTETLTLSYPALDERAQPLPASPFLVELERAFGEAKIPKTVQPLDGGRRFQDESEPPLSRSGLRRGAVARALDGNREMLAALSSNSGRHVLGGPPTWTRSSALPAPQHADADEGMAPGADLPPHTIGQSILAGIDAVADRGRREEFGAFEGVIASDAASARLRERFGAGHLWSPSQLETYAVCPFVFFGKHLLNLRPTPEMALQNDMGRRGGVLHETLAQLYSQLRGAPVDPEQLADVLTQQFHDVLAAVTQARPGRGLDAALREIERRQIAAWAEDFARQDLAYRQAWQSLDTPPEPAHFEARFGRGSRESQSSADAAVSTDQPLALPVVVDGVAEIANFTGQIDRIDVGRVGETLVFNVIDYKSGKRHDVKETDIHAGKQLQLALYAMAAESLGMAGPRAVPLSAGYWAVQGKGYGGKGGAAGALAFHQIESGGLTPAPAWDTTREKLVTKIGELIAAIRRGQFPVFNDDLDCTKFCELRTICRIAQVRSLEKHWPTGATRLEKKNKE
jgi:superfamily I DNA/RNA helicase